MQITYETITIFVWLIPGFLSSLVLNAVVVRKEKDGLSKIIEALVFTFLIYGVVSFLGSGSPVLLKSETIGGETSYSMRYNPAIVLATVFLSVALPLLIGRLATTDRLMAFLRRCRITEKTSRQSLWEDVFTDQKRCIVVNLSDGRRVIGWPLYYSATPDEGCIYLHKPAWIADGKYIETNMHGMFLVKRDNIDSIEFTHLDKEAIIRLRKEKSYERQTTAK
jgi:hypothetical protein